MLNNMSSSISQQPQFNIEAILGQLNVALSSSIGLGDTVANYLSERGVSLSQGALLMLLIPIFEARNQITNVQLSGLRMLTENDTAGIETQVSQESLLKLVNDIVESPARIDGIVSEVSEENKRTSLSVIKAFWKNFCNIPPFCSEK